MSWLGVVYLSFGIATLIILRTPDKLLRVMLSVLWPATWAWTIWQTNKGNIDWRYYRD